MTPRLSFCAEDDTLVVMSDLFRLDTGSGNPVVLLHGGFLDHGLWAAQIPVLARTHRVIAPDARGHGRSPVATAPFRHTDDLADLLRELNTGPAVLIGVSMGAATAVDTALEHPALVRALVLTGAGTSEPYFTDPWTVRAFGAWTSAMAAGDLAGSVDGFLQFVAGPRRALADVDPRVAHDLRAMATATMSKHAAGEPNWMRPVPRTWERVPSIEVPVLAVHGAVDSPDHLGMAQRVTDEVRDGRAVTVEGAAHYPMAERPGVYTELITGFLTEIDR
jgi:pimeloyl-ACP methyl ester carboxylesterase